MLPTMIAEIAAKGNGAVARKCTGLPQAPVARNVPVAARAGGTVGRAEM